VLLLPVVFASNTPTPKAELFDPVVVAVKDKYPTPVLLDAVVLPAKT